MQHKKIAFIGAGNMAKAIIAGLVANDYPTTLITASDPNQEQRDKLRQQLAINTTQDNQQAAQDADVIILAVKPQLMQAVVETLSAVDISQKLVISIAAGISSRRLNELFATPVRLVRVMPNTPALLGLGMSGLYASPELSQQEKDFSYDLLSAVGEAVWVSSESDIDVVTAVSGSGPAYFFLFMEAMHKEALQQGFDEDTARLLVQQTALGAAKMVMDNPHTSIATLRENVTSKGGTTAAALNVFNQATLSDTVAQAMQAAVSRAEEMEQLF